IGCHKLGSVTLDGQAQTRSRWGMTRRRRKEVMMTRRLMFGALLACMLPGLATAQTDHLKCYKVVDPLLLKGPAGKPPVEWLDLNSPDFGSEQCRVISGFRLFCVPVTK